MQKIYIAGPYSAPNIIQGLENIRAGQRMATKLLLHGFAVFAPWLDHQLFLQLREGESISLETIQEHSMAWLRVADAVLVLKGFEASRGTLEEMRVAYDIGIPVYFNYLDLLNERPSNMRRAKMKCPDCNTKLRAEWKFCPLCGYEVEEESMESITGVSSYDNGEFYK